MNIGYIVKDQFFWDEDCAKAYGQFCSCSPLSVVPDLIPLLAKGEIVCFEFRYENRQLATMTRSNRWAEPRQVDEETLLITVVAKDLNMAIEMAKNIEQDWNYTWED